ncbi:MAG: endonuclease [Allomuricauda sp.]|nr:MAG: endonuclease [Allomuricauda sp.]
MGNHNEFGKQGEQLAVDFLTKKGYVIKQRNYRFLKGEIDIIAQKGKILAIVEVKSRNKAFVASISDTVNHKKKKLLIETANNYVIEEDLEVEVRFDIVTVVQKEKKIEIVHLEDAFYNF